MHLIYNIGIYLYGLAIHIAALFSSKAAKRALGGRRALAYLKEHIQPESEYVWFHAASLGEFEQGRPIIEQMRKVYPETKIVLTFFSPSGYEIKKNYAGADIVCYLPLDTPRNAKAFVSLVRPKKAIFIKYEFWGNLLTALHKEHVPTYLVSSIFREKQIFFHWYGGFFRRLLTCFSTIFVQDIASMKLLSSIGVTNVMVSGDTRFDRVTDIAKNAKQLPIIEGFAKDRPVLIAGSTWREDETLLISAFEAQKEYKLIIVPHEPTQANIAGITAKLNCCYACYSQTDQIKAADLDCLIIDSIGLLSSIYQYGQVAYIGGGFGNGIHNTLEPAVWGLPVIFGPNYQRFKEACELIDANGALSINSENDLKHAVAQFFQDKSAGEKAAQYVRTHTGATDIVMLHTFGNDAKGI